MKLFLIGKYPEKNDTEEYTKCWLKALDKKEADYFYKKLFFKEEPLKTLLRIPYYIILTWVKRPKILHAQYFADVVGPLFPCLLLLKYPGTKVVLTVHEKPDFLLKALPKYLKPFYLWYERFTLSLANLIITHTEEAKKSLEDNYKLKRIKVSFFPWYKEVEIAKNKESLKSDYKINQEIIFTIFGRLVPKKGTDLALEPLKKLIDEGYDAGLIIAGPEPDKYKKYHQELDQKIKELSLENRVYKLGFLSTQQVTEVMKMTDISLLLYRSVTQSGVFYTCLPHEVPVICADLPGFSEFMNQNKVGELVDPENSDQVVEAMKKIINNKNNYNLKELKEIYSWNRAIEKYEQLYKEL